MNMRIALSIVLSCALLAIPAAAADVGDRVGDFRLTDVNGNSHALSGYSGRVVLLAFWSFKCPVALAYTDRLRSLQDKYAGRGVTILAIDSSANESAAEVRRNASNLGLSFPVLMDPDGVIAERLGATQTPHVFILDRGGVVRYQGAIDNNKRPGDGERIAHVEEALDSLLAGRAVQLPETTPFGCTIHR
jgi:peroxiredoxin